MIIDWPNGLVDEIARRRSVIFPGAGTSMQSSNAAGERPKSWDALLRAAIASVPGAERRKTEIRALLNQGDYLTACEVIREQMGNHAFQQFLVGELQTPNFQPAPIHDSIVQLGSRIVATPNFDKILESRMQALPHNPVRIKNYYDTDIAMAARGSTSVLLKVHGTIDQPDRMIFSRADYAKARVRHRSFYSVLESLALTHTFLFIGCGLNDPDIRLILEDHAFAFSDAWPHYFVMKKGTLPNAHISTIERNLNVKILLYPDDHSQLKPAVDELVTLVNQKRAEMQVNRSW